MITEKDIDRFTTGDCHILAWAINRMTGWPIYTFLENGKYPDLHAFIVTPDGQALDVKGYRSLKSLKKEWRCKKIGKIDWRNLLDSWGGPCYGSHSRKRAKKIAAYLIASNSSQVKENR